MPNAFKRPLNSPLKPQVSPVRLTSPRLPQSPATSPARLPTLRTLAALCTELRLRDSRSRTPWRVALLCIVCTLFLAALHFFTHTRCIPLAHPSPALHSLQPYHSFLTAPDIFDATSDFIYIPYGRLLITTTAKVASTALWTWLHPAIVGHRSQNPCNTTYIQHFAHPCWQGKPIHPSNLSRHQKYSLLKSASVLRVAITRDPFQRLLSAWKSKVACDSHDFGTDVQDRVKFVPRLLRQAGMNRTQDQCLSLAGFAQVLDRLRIKAEQNRFDLRTLNIHFRPQLSYFSVIDYDIIMDISHVSNASVFAPILRRLQFPALADDQPAKMHASSQRLQAIPETTAVQLFKFARLTENFPPPRFLHPR
ncbi:hypothetical protein BWQ96_05153 [Gracilariopsis chorda]|uniref:Uncharacterized protein n=1 Tax=Gracilariopsis chorda TaxID=448386 RepID=A0A2V3ISN0_9FLOR|nr:hypothetical protein BWQ96_05153 [Gracilariopsis chorda]|eukprot:PXF45114.1 hypothetical protein BWQ96_05153 [Gracilariopsis chorda]